MRITKLFGILMVIAIVLPLAGAFAQEEEMMEEVTLPEVDPLFVEGDIIIAGSSTVYPLTQAVAERFTEAGYGGQITIDSIGTGGGFERFCVAAETDISNASRPINEEEMAACEENGRTPIEFRVGTDALAVVVSVENDFIGEEGLTIEQLGMIFSGEAATWADVNAEWPAEPIVLYSPGTDSGTFDYFVEEVMDAHAEAMGADLDADEEAGARALLEAGNVQLSEDDNVLVQGVSDSPYGIGYFGYAYFQENEDVVRALNINGVTPTAESVESTGDDAYPLARPLFIYSAASVLEEKPQVASFISYYLSNVNEVITEVGYFPASVEALNDAKYHWLTVECGMGMVEDEELCTAAMEHMEMMEGE